MFWFTEGPGSSYLSTWIDFLGLAGLVRLPVVSCDLADSELGLNIRLILECAWEPFSRLLSSSRLAVLYLKFIS